MHRIALTLLFALFLLPTKICRSDYIIASYQPVPDFPLYGFLDTLYAAQTFTATDSGVLSNISVRLTSTPPSPTGFIFDIRATSGGVPGASLGTVSVTSPSLSSATPTVVTANFDSLGVNLIQNTVYAFSIRSNGPQVASLSGTNNGGYAGGILYQTNNGTTWNPVVGGLYDASFVVTGISAVPEPSSVSLAGLFAVAVVERFRRRNSIASRMSE